MSSLSEKTGIRPKYKPRIVVHGGAGNLTRKNLSPHSRETYLAALSRILSATYTELLSGLPALDAVTMAVKLLEDDPLFNAGKGAVFTLEGTNELEASVMVSRGQHKRCASGYLLKHVKNPVLFAKALLLRDNPAVERGRQHNCLSGEYAEKLAEKWGLEMVDQDYFFTERRWQQHLKDLERDKAGMDSRPGDPYVSIEAGGEMQATGEGRPLISHIGDIEPEAGSNNGDSWKECNDLIDQMQKDMKEQKENVVPGKPLSGAQGAEEEEPLIWLDEYLPKGTVGCVVMDSEGVIAAATSTGGLTNKVPGRIGDTPTPGAGYWAEEWEVEDNLGMAESLKQQLALCLPFPSSTPSPPLEVVKRRRAVGLSGTGNGDYFLRLAACHNIASRCRFGGRSLKQAAKEVCGRGGEMERAAEGRNDFDGAVIGIDQDGEVIMEMNCGGCFRGTVDVDGRVLVAAYADEPLEEFGRVR